LSASTTITANITGAVSAITPKNDQVHYTSQHT
jgi:hypothetical protein